MTIHPVYKLYIECALPKTFPLPIDEIALITRFANLLENIGELQDVTLEGVLAHSNASTVYTGYQGQKPIVLKQFYSHKAGLIVEALRYELTIASAHMNDPRYRLNTCLGVFPAHGIAVLSRVPGVTALTELLSASPKRRSDLLDMCGRWLASYIGPRHQPRPFSSATWAKTLDSIAVPAVGKEKRHILETLSHTLKDVLSRIDGADVTYASTHRDFRAKNVMIDGSTVYGIDIQSKSRIPLSRDLARFLVTLQVSHQNAPVPMQRGVILADKAALLSSGQITPNEDTQIFDFFVGLQLYHCLINRHGNTLAFKNITVALSSYFEAVNE